jgi:heme/copper-type cytochrome/quinol oxidase subunit 2
MLHIGENMRTRRRSVVLVSLALAAATVLGGCGGGETDRLKADDGPVEGGNAITPAKLTAHEGREVEIAVTNTAKDKQHGFKIAEFGIEEVIDQGKTTTVKFKADKAGTFQVVCHLHPTHKPAELVVS